MNAHWTTLLAGALLSATVWADQIQSLTEIREAARGHVEDHFKGAEIQPRVSTGRLDSRLHLKACDVPLSTEFPSGSNRIGNITVRVRCQGSKPWSLYVPVKVQQWRPVVVLSRSMAPGSLLQAGDVRLEERELGRLNGGYFASADEVIGKQLVRSTRTGLVLNPQNVRAPKIIKRGQQVILEASLEGLTVNMNGTALADGALGDRIKVKNQTSKRVIEGIVERRGVVSLSL